MNESMIRNHIQKHADAAVRGDMDTVAADFYADLRPRLPMLAQALPQPLVRAEVVSVTFGDACRGPVDRGGSGTAVCERPARARRRRGRPRSPWCAFGAAPLPGRRGYDQKLSHA